MKVLSLVAGAAFSSGLLFGLLCIMAMMDSDERMQRCNHWPR